jgi:hypothetical protein
MPTMANIVVQDASATNRTYTAAVPSAGESSPAIWRRNDGSVQLAIRPSFQVLTKDNARQNGRLFRCTFVYPVKGTDTTTSQDIILAKIPFEINGTLPTNVDAAVVNDAFVQLGNLLVSTLIRSCVQEGYAPT